MAGQKEKNTSLWVSQRAKKTSPNQSSAKVLSIWSQQPESHSWHWRMNHPLPSGNLRGKVGRKARQVVDVPAFSHLVW